MRWSLKVASVAGIEVRIHLTFLLFLAWIWFRSRDRAGQGITPTRNEGLAGKSRTRSASTCPCICYRAGGRCLVTENLFWLEASADGAIHDSADNPDHSTRNPHDSSHSDNSVVRNNRGIRSRSKDNSQGNNSPVHLRRPQSGHLLSQAAE